MILYSSKFLKVNYLELQYLTHFYFGDYAATMDEEGVYHEFVNFLNKRIYKRGNQIFVDWRKVENLISQETADWFIQYILPKIASHKAYRLAFLLTDLSIMELPKVVKVNNTQFIAKVFTDSEKAMAWIMDGAERKEPGQDDHDHDHDHGHCHV